jgi:hypothetical protein
MGCAAFHAQRVCVGCVEDVKHVLLKMSAFTGEVENYAYKLPCTLLKEAQLNLVALLRPCRPRWLPYHLIRVNQWHRLPAPPMTVGGPVSVTHRKQSPSVQ